MYYRWGGAGAQAPSSGRRRRPSLAPQAALFYRLGAQLHRPPPPKRWVTVNAWFRVGGLSFEGTARSSRNGLRNADAQFAIRLI